MTKDYGNIILQSEPPRIKLALGLCVLLGGAIGYVAITFLVSIGTATGVGPRIYATSMGITLAVLSYTVVSAGLMYFIPYVKVFERGIVVRRVNLFLFPWKQAIPYESIIDADLVKGNKVTSRIFLVLYTQDAAPYWAGSEFCLNLKEIQQEISTRKCGTSQALARVNFWKRRYGKYGSYREILRPLEFPAPSTTDGTLIIDTNVPLPRNTWLHGWKTPITFEEFRHTGLHLVSCQDVRLGNCVLARLTAKDCVGLHLNNTQIRREIVLKNTTHVTVGACTIRKLQLDKVQDLAVRDSTIDAHHEYASKQNTFEGSHIGKLETNVKADSFHGRNTLTNTEVSALVAGVKKKKKDSILQRYPGLLTSLIVGIPIVIGIILGIYLRG